MLKYKQKPAYTGVLYKNKDREAIMRYIYRMKQFMLLGGDFLSFILGFWLSLGLRYGTTPSWDKIEGHIGPLFILFIFWIIILFISGLFDLQNLKDKNYHIHFVEAAAISFVFGLVFFYVYPGTVAPKTILLFNVIIGFSLSYIWRIIYNKNINSGIFQEKIILVGINEETKELIRILENNPERGYKIMALIDPDNKTKKEDFPFFDISHELGDIKEAVDYFHAHAIVIAPHLKKNEEILKILYNFLLQNIKIIDLTSFYEVITGRIPPTTFSEAWFLEHLKNQEKPIFEKVRALVDFLAGIIMFLFMIILLPFIILAIKINSPGPIFYTQKRVGKNGKLFELYKFRSMFALDKSGGAELHGAQFATKHDERITKIGKFLRKSRLDELPQCINILKKDISLIGPRPERPEIVAELEKIMPYYSLRHIIKPGLTGWAAIHQNYTDTLDTSLQKLQYDLFYIKNRSFALDISIILRTVNVVMRLLGQ